MTILNTTEEDVGYIEEVTPGTTPSTPSLLAIPCVSASIKPVSAFAESDEMGVGGQVEDVLKTRESAMVSLDTCMRFPAVNSGILAIWENIMRSDIGTATSFTGTTISASASGNTLDDSGDTAFANVVVGQWIQVDGLVNGANSGRHYVIAKADNGTVTVATTLTNETAGNSVTIKGQMLRNGTTKHAGTFEEQKASNLFFYSRGTTLNTFNISISDQGVVKLKLEGPGMEFGKGTSSLDAGGGYTQPGTKVIDANNGVIDMRYDSFAADSSLEFNKCDITLTSNTREIGAVRRTTLLGIGIGQFRGEASVDFFLEDGTLIGDFTAGTAKKFALHFEDPDGNQWVLTFLNCRITECTADAAGHSQEQFVKLKLTGIKEIEVSLAATVQLDLFAAA